MTFYEAALDILRREGKPLHFEEITRRALEEGLLSHVGRVPSDIMRARLLAMAHREDGKSLAVVEPGVFALAAWGMAQDHDALKETEPKSPDTGTKLRPNERTPMTLAEKRSAREAERSGKLQSEDKEARTRGRRRRRRPRKGETAADALASIVVELGGGPIDLQYVVDAIPSQSALPQGFPTDLDGLRGLVSTENERLEKAGEAPRFMIEGDRVALPPEPPPREPPSPARPKEEKLAARRREIRQAAPGKLLEALRGLSQEKLEQVFLELASRHSFADAKVAKRSAKGSPLFTGMVRFGVGQLRIAVRMLLSGREVRVDDIDELRGDLENYNAAAGVLLGLGKVPRAARSQAEDMSQKPVLLFDGESLAMACADSGIGVRSRLQEVVEVDPALLETVSTDSRGEQS